MASVQAVLKKIEQYLEKKDKTGQNGLLDQRRMIRLKLKNTQESLSELTHLMERRPDVPASVQTRFFDICNDFTKWASSVSSGLGGEITEQHVLDTQKQFLDTFQQNLQTLYHSLSMHVIMGTHAPKVREENDLQSAILHFEEVLNWAVGTIDRFKRSEERNYIDVFKQLGRQIVPPSALTQVAQFYPDPRHSNARTAMSIIDHKTMSIDGIKSHVLVKRDPRGSDISFEAFFWALYLSCTCAVHQLSPSEQPLIGLICPSEASVSHVVMHIGSHVKSQASKSAASRSIAGLTIETCFLSQRELLRVLLVEFLICHALGITCRDVKPENSLWYRSRIFLIDFGGAKKHCTTGSTYATPGLLTDQDRSEWTLPGQDLTKLLMTVSKWDIPGSMEPEANKRRYEAGYMTNVSAKAPKAELSQLWDIVIGTMKSYDGVIATHLLVDPEVCRAKLRDVAKHVLISNAQLLLQPSSSPQASPRM